MCVCAYRVSGAECVNTIYTAIHSILSGHHQKIVSLMIVIMHCSKHSMCVAPLQTAEHCIVAIACYNI